jgi:hypothetical protein
MQDQEHVDPESELEQEQEPASDPVAGEADIRALVRRLSRPHSSGGRVIERAAILAEGSTSRAILAWIEDHGGLAEELVTRAPTGGLHGARGQAVSRGLPQRYVLPADALDG